MSVRCRNGLQDFYKWYRLPMTGNCITTTKFVLQKDPLEGGVVKLCKSKLKIWMEMEDELKQ